MQQQAQVKVPKGTLDSDPFSMNVFDSGVSIIKKIFKRHGACQIDTPVFECKDTLLGKYGTEGQKLIYDLCDQGGELLSLRYDLTVPFARYMALHGLQNMKRFHIAKVYRRDQPNMQQKRLREFYQCDFDIAGVYNSMFPDAEVIKVFNDILTELDLGIPFSIKLNSRKILDSMVQLSGAPVEKFKEICSSIDKLDKLEWDEVKKELLELRQLEPKTVELLGTFVKYKGKPMEVLEKLKADSVFQQSKQCQETLVEMQTLFTFLKEMNALDNCVFDLSLARGLDYYTGLIFEAVLEGAEVGSIAGGGRYDNLIGMFSSKQIPAVGGSLGISRILGILEQKYKKDYSIRNTESLAYVATIGDNLSLERIKLLNSLWANQIPSETSYDENPKIKNQFRYAQKNQIPFVLIIGENELKQGIVKCKCLYTKEEEAVPKDQIIAYIQTKIQAYQQDLKNKLVKFEQDDEKEQQK